MDIERTIDRHGVALLAIHDEHPYEPGWAYTIGRHRRGAAELVVCLNSQRVAGNLLNELTPQGVPLASLGPDQRIAVAALDGMEVTFRSAVLPWSWDRCRVAFMQDEVQDPNDVEVLQVVLPDAEGRLPGDPGRDATCMCCPDLSGPGGFLYAQPFIAPDLRWCGAEHGPHHLVDDGLLVSAPVINGGSEWIERHELLPARRVDEEHVEILAPPVLADWTTTGAIHRLVPPGSTGDPRLDGHDTSPHPVLGEVVMPAPGVQLNWALYDAPIETSDSSADALDEAPAPAGARQVPEAAPAGARDATTVIDWILGNEALTSTITDRWLSVTAMPREARRVRSRMRRLERDGLARPLALTSAPPGEVCNVPGCCFA